MSECSFCTVAAVAHVLGNLIVQAGSLKPTFVTLDLRRPHLLSMGQVHIDCVALLKFE